MADTELMQIRGGNERHRQRQTTNSRKGWRREIEADALLRLRMERMRTHQCERLATETTADKDARLQQMSALQHKSKG